MGRFDILFLLSMMVGLIFIPVSCTLDRDRVVDRSRFTFKTYDDTELFFKNMRASYYTMEEVSADKLWVYRNKKQSTGALIKLAIVMDWREDRAYLLLELDELLMDEEPLTLHWSSSDGAKGEILLEEKNTDGMLEFATQVYEGILQGHVFSILILGESFSFLEDKEAREAFRVTVSDYFRLTRVF